MSMSPEKKTVTWLVGVVVTMGALAWAAVPFYDWFCRVTGFGGTTQVAVSAPDHVLDEVVRVRFDANVDKNLEWTFRPMQTSMEIKIGENGLAFYEAINNSDVPITGTASYNVAPEVSGYYFSKIECFCFTEQTLQPGERIEMPVSFYVDPELVTDRDASWIRDITLSYTFHRTEPKQASLDVAPADNVN
ncbi:cytochrome c oxidase assembly protein [Paracoccus sp. AK26]|uniref:cytochrome c oxidase assembly protein n=1 Tax=Paracoccus sp. AK26 TaxID=2589076 RepID=UPI001427FC6E|nr:cytochrome c oxidase assembly protein [Paracoccus sp. AK26]QIR84284.1 cytochrome c oxidase assembly protein [Paracoccus sp. AK26]